MTGMFVWGKGQETGPWKGSLLREDGKTIDFHFDLRNENGKTVLYIINAGERLRVDRLVHSKDSLVIEMPVFESQFRVRKLSAGKWEGVWIKEGAVKRQVMPFTAQVQSSLPAEPVKPAITDITGRWAVTFMRGNDLTRPAVGEWQQKGYTLRGTILTPTGDYRYLSGVLDGDSLKLSTFDGSHAFLFTAKVNSDQKITGGIFYSGATAKEPWEAVKNPAATLPDVAAMHLKDGEEKLNFRFRDLNGKMVSINDPRFRNKVVIIQIMGSWCPNCMDETAFLSEFYDKNKSRGVEVIGLAYEYSTDWERSKKSIQKFRDRFHVKYTLLNTGVTVTDSLRTEKTLPQLTPIKSFPSTIFLDKQGRVAKLHAGFEGPGTGLHYEALKKEFAETVEKLLGGQK
jgi:thiol-disulfide isomerase/thioredoxin